MARVFPSYSYSPVHFISFFLSLFLYYLPLPPLLHSFVSFKFKDKSVNLKSGNFNSREVSFQSELGSNQHLSPSVQQAPTLSPSKPFCSLLIPRRTVYLLFIYFFTASLLIRGHSKRSWPGETFLSILQRNHSRLTFQDFRMGSTKDEQRVLNSNYLQNVWKHSSLK